MSDASRRVPSVRENAGRLHGDDLISEVLRNMEEGLFRIREKTIVPSIYRIYLNPDDYEPFRNVSAFVAGEIRASLDSRLADWNGKGLKVWPVAKKAPQYTRLDEQWTVEIFPDLDNKLQRGEIEVYSELGAPQKVEYGAGSLTRRIFPKGQEPQTQEAQPPAGATPGTEPGEAATDKTRRTSVVEEDGTKGLSFAYLRYADTRGKQVFEVTKPLIVIGRGGRSYWVDVKLEAPPDVSREHCRIRRDPETGRFTIEDVSQFGTAVNGKPVGQNASAELPNRATISLAGVIDLEWEAA